MAGGLVALLDDIAAMAKLAAASVDDVGAAAGRASAKAAGVVVDDTAVTPRYVQGLTPDRELPIIKQIALGLAAQQAALHPPGGAAAQPVPAVAADPDPHARRHLPLLRGRREDLGEGRRPRARTRSTWPPATPTTRRRWSRRDPHRLHPLGRDHGHRAQRGRRRAVRLARGHPRARRHRHHRARLRRRRAHREDGRHRPAPRRARVRRGAHGRPRPGRRDAEAALGAVDDRHRRDALGRRPHPARRRRRARLARALRPRAPRRGGRRRRASLGWLVNTLASALIGLVVGAVVVAVVTLSRSRGLRRPPPTEATAAHPSASTVVVEGCSRMPRGNAVDRPTTLAPA